MLQDNMNTHSLFTICLGNAYFILINLSKNLNTMPKEGDDDDDDDDDDGNNYINNNAIYSAFSIFYALCQELDK